MTTKAPSFITATMDCLHHGCLLVHSEISSAICTNLDPTTIHASIGISTVISCMASPTINSSMVPPIISSMASPTIYLTLVPLIWPPLVFQHLSSPSSISRTSSLAPSIYPSERKAAPFSCPVFFVYCVLHAVSLLFLHFGLFESILVSFFFNKRTYI